MQCTPEVMSSQDMVITDFLGVNHALGLAAAAQHPQRCKFRVLDVYGTDDSYNMADNRGPYCCMHLHLQQLWTFIPNYSPGNDFLWYVVKSFRPLQAFQAAQQQQQQAQAPSRAFEVLLYGKAYKIFNDDHAYIQQLLQVAPVHATAMGWPSNSPLQGVHNWGVLPHQQLHSLMARTFAYAGLPAIMVGPAAIEAMSQGVVFLNYGLPPWNMSEMMGKPTTQLWTSQFPYLEPYEPHVLTLDPKNATDLKLQLSTLRATCERWWGRGSSGAANQQQEGHTHHQYHHQQQQQHQPKWWAKR
jgi:hypothetical protein